MAFIKKLFRFLWGFADRILCVVFALAMTQVPTYVSQYLVELDSVRNLSQQTYVGLDAEAARFNLDVDSYLAQQRLFKRFYDAVLAV